MQENALRVEANLLAKKAKLKAKKRVTIKEVPSSFASADYKIESLL